MIRPDKIVATQVTDNSIQAKLNMVYVGSSYPAESREHIEQVKKDLCKSLWNYIYGDIRADLIIALKHIKQDTNITSSQKSIEILEKLIKDLTYDN